MNKEQYKEICRHYKRNPVGYCEDILGVSLTPDQRKILTSLTIKPYKTLVRSGNNLGKCFGIDTPIMMSDGSIKKVQDIVVGDYVMGADSLPKEVLSLGRGREELYEVSGKGISYIVNKSHILALKDKGTKPNRFKRGQARTITVEDYLKSNANFKRLTGGYRVGVKFKSKKVKIDPYWLGVWLGDGNSHNSGITTENKEVVEVIYSEAEIRGLKVRKNSQEDNKSSTYTSTKIIRSSQKNNIVLDLESYNLIKNKHIPNDYKKNSRKVRFALLAGLIDTDGYKSNQGDYYEFCNKNKGLVEDVIWLARSLGFAAYLTSGIKRSQNGTEGLYYRCGITGKCWLIPVKIPYKKIQKHKIKRSTTTYGIEVKPVGVGNYYGFYIGGDGLFLLSDFTVVHNTFIEACAALYMFDCYDPSITIITAPKFEQIQKNLFKEIRSLGKIHHKLYELPPKAPELFDNFNHMILGITANTPDSMKGIHDAAVSFIVDEMAGVEPEFVSAIHTMLGGDGYFMLSCFNPTNQASVAFTAELDAQRTNSYHLFELSALKHPNIIAELQGLPAPYPNAIRLERLRENINLWCEVVKDVPKDTDFEFEGQWWRPSADGECAILGRWSTNASVNIWSMNMFLKCIENVGDFGHNHDIAIGIDCAAYGDDDSVIVVRRGTCLVHVESHNGWGARQLSGRVKEIVDDYTAKYSLRHFEKIPIVCDDTGVGMQMREHFMGTDYNFIPINFSGRSHSPHLYRHRRDEIHFEMADKAKAGQVSFKHIPKWIQDELRLQLLAPTYCRDLSGKRVVEPKDKTKEIIGKSPDMADAVLLCYMKIDSDKIEHKAPDVKKTDRKWLV